MLKQRSNFITALLLVIVLVMSSIYVESIVVQASTRTEITKKVTTLENTIKQLKAKKKAAVKKENAAKKGTTAIYGDIVSNNPFIVRVSLFYENTYYWVTNPNNLSRLFTIATGYVIPTGSYRYYNGIPCVECKAKKVTSTSYSIQSKIDEKNEKLKEYKTALKDKVVLESITLYKGKSKKIPRSWRYSGKYNTIKWKSSNSKVASVDKNGKVTAKKAGTVTITATASASGKKTTCKVKVKTPCKSITFEQSKYTFKNSDLDSNSMVSIKLNMKPASAEEEITVTSSDPYVAQFVKEKNGVCWFSIYGEGTTTITAKSSTGKKATCKLTYSNKIESITFEQEVYSYLETDGYITLYLNINPEYYNDKIYIESSNERIMYYNGLEEVKNNGVVQIAVYMYICDSGTSTVTARTESGLSTTCTLNIEEVKENIETNYDNLDEEFDESY